MYLEDCHSERLDPPLDTFLMVRVISGETSIVTFGKGCSCFISISYTIYGIIEHAEIIKARLL